MGERGEREWSRSEVPPVLEVKWSCIIKLLLFTTKRRIECELFLMRGSQILIWFRF